VKKNWGGKDDEDEEEEKTIDHHMHRLHKTDDLIDVNKQNMTNSQRLGPFLIYQMNSCCVGGEREECIMYNYCTLFVLFDCVSPRICARMHLAALLETSDGEGKKERAQSVFLGMRDSSAWLQPAWTIQCRNTMAV